MNPFNATRQELNARLVEKANQDPKFRQDLLNNPKEAVSQFLGIKLPNSFQLTIIEEEIGSHVLVLPPSPISVEALSLQDLELALVGGGRTLRPAAQFAVEPYTNPRTLDHTLPRSSC